MILLSKRQDTITTAGMHLEVVFLEPPITVLGHSLLIGLTLLFLVNASGRLQMAEDIGFGKCILV